MDRQRRKELVEQFQKIEIMMGVVRVTNTRNGKMFIAAFPDLNKKLDKLRGLLKDGRFMNMGVQNDWNEYGEDAFTFEILEEKSTKDMDNVRREMRSMENEWREMLEPYGDKGYHVKS